MILILLGTFQIEFKRPLIEIEKLCIQNNLTEELIVQCGHTKYTSPYFKMLPFIEPAALDLLYDKARIIITHAGTGSIIKGLKMRKKVIAIARLRKFGEHIDDHQLEILTEFATSGYLLPWNENDSIKQILLKAEHFKPMVYVSRKENILNYLQNYIDSL